MSLPAGTSYLLPTESRRSSNSNIPPNQPLSSSPGEGFINARRASRRRPTGIMQERYRWPCESGYRPYLRLSAPVVAAPTGTTWLPRSLSRGHTDTRFRPLALLRPQRGSRYSINRTAMSNEPIVPATTAIARPMMNARFQSDCRGCCSVTVHCSFRLPLGARTRCRGALPSFRRAANFAVWNERRRGVGRRPACNVGHGGKITQERPAGVAPGGLQSTCYRPNLDGDGE